MAHIFLLCWLFSSLSSASRRCHNLGRFSRRVLRNSPFVFFSHLARSSFTCYSIHSSQVMKAIYVVNNVNNVNQKHAKAKRKERERERVTDQKLLKKKENLILTKALHPPRARLPAHRWRRFATIKSLDGFKLHSITWMHDGRAMKKHPEGCASIIMKWWFPTPESPSKSARRFTCKRKDDAEIARTEKIGKKVWISEVKSLYFVVCRVVVVDVVSPTIETI